MPLSESPRCIEDLSDAKIKNCECCGNEFTCGGKRCWCEVIKLCQSKFNTRRAIDFHEGEKIDEEALKTLVRAAVTLNKSTAQS